MHSRSRLLLALFLAVTATACASGGATTTTDGDAAPSTTVSERTFPPGTEPRRNVWTRSAQIYLDQAEDATATDEKQRNFTQALEQARLSVQNEPNNALGYYQAGMALIGLEQYEEAGRMLDRAEEIYPRYVLDTGPRRQNAWVALYNRAVQSLQQNDEDAAISQMLLADQIYQGRPEARANLAVIYTGRSDYESAIEWYERTLETLRSEQRQYLPANVQEQWAQQESDVIFNMAQVYNLMDRRADAIALYREYLADNPDDASVKVQLALALSTEGQEAEAASLFSEVLNMTGLADDEYYQIGIGLFNAGRFGDAATAFERAVAANPHFRDAIFNLSQSLMAQGSEMADADASDAELEPIYERMVEVGQTLRQIDPYSRTGALVLANAYRNLADLSTGASSTQLRNQLVQLLEAIEAMPIDVTSVGLAPAGTGRVELAGTIQNLTLDPGTPIVLRLSLVDPAGTPVSTQEVRVAAPAREGTVAFASEFPVTGEIAGWRYELIQ